MNKNTIERSGQVKMFSNDETPREVQNKGCVGAKLGCTSVELLIISLS